MKWSKIRLALVAVLVFCLVANIFADDEKESTKSSTRLRLRGRGRGKTRGTSTTTAASSDTSAETTSKKPVSRRTGGGRFRGSSSSKSSDDDDQTPAGSIQSKVSTRLRPTNRLGVAASGSKSKSTSSNSVDGKKKIVCYYTNWSQYRPNIGKFLPENIPADLCTHMIFAFGWQVNKVMEKLYKKYGNLIGFFLFRMKKGKLSSFEGNDETKDGKIGLYDKINGLKKVNPDLKTLLAIGGWSFGTQKFKEMSATRYTRQIFIFSAIPYLRERNFDGLDIDWEYPKGSDDKKNYVLLLKELQEAFIAEAEEAKRPKLLLTAAVPVGPDSIRGGYDVPAVAKYLDILNIMAYGKNVFISIIN
ncbi:Chitotriosidase-1 [Folsomia candida]|uniref:Chitotriosidase-1 n=1 Tax=Folsomia candida TaxID=158441 RepID=A0A226EG58_FOLCA|nr:Chitotriosidase-1 [Folsomia candida]